MKSKVLIILLSFANTLFSQQVSNNPFELYWNSYVLEFNSAEVTKYNIKKVTASIIEKKNNKIKKESLYYVLEFDSLHRPKRYMVQTEFQLRSDYRYNPIWRMLNEYPVYDILEYQLSYDSQGRLSNITETKKHTNYEYEFMERIQFVYDNLDRVIEQSFIEIYQFGGQNLKNRYTINYFEKTDSVLYIQETTDLENISTVSFNLSNRFKLEEFHFGDRFETFMRNIPIDRNSKIWDATDVNSKIERNQFYLRTWKELNLSNEGYAAPKTRRAIGYQYEYF